MPHPPPVRAVSRRALARGVAWTVPVVAVGAAAPALAASCALSTTQKVVWTTNADNDTSYRTQLGATAGGSTVSVSTAWTGTSGGIDTSANMSSRTVTTSNDAILISNDVPTVSSGLAGNYQTITFAFSTAVHNLTFTIDDIDRVNNGGTRPGYYDQVAIVSGPGFTAVVGNEIQGTGTLTDPWETLSTSGGGSYVPSQSVKVTFAGPVTSFALRFWSRYGDFRTGEFNLVRITGMGFQTCL